MTPINPVNIKNPSTEIVLHSVSNDLTTALKEWNFKDFETLETTHSSVVCLCGKSLEGNPLNTRWFNFFNIHNFKTITLEPECVKNLPAGTLEKNQFQTAYMIYQVQQGIL